MIMKRLFVTTVVLCFSGMFIFAEEKSFTLQEAVRYAMAHSPTIDNAKKDVQLSKEKVNEIKAIGLPQVNASGNFMQNMRIPVQIIPNFTNNFLPPGAPRGDEFIELAFAQKYTAIGNIQLTQLLFDGSYLVGLQASRDVVNLYEILENRSSIEIENNVSKAYLLALLMKENVKMLEVNLNSIRKTLEQTTAINQQGLIEKLDVDRLTLTKNNLEIQFAKLKMQADITEKLLKFQMGMPIQEPIVLSDQLEKLMAEMNQDYSKETLSINNRVEYKLLGKQIDLLKLDEKRYKMSYLPSLALVMNQQYASFRSEFNFFEGNLPANNRFIPSNYWALGLQVPIFDGLKKEAQRAQARLNREKAENDRLNFENAANLDAAQSQVKYTSSKSMLKQQQASKELALNIYQTTLKKFQAGVGSSFEYTQAETELTNANGNYLNAVYEVLVSQLELKKALGK
jgi:outer membrane protein